MSEEKKDGVIIKVLPDFATLKEEKRVYANYFSVSHDIYNFVLTFCDSHFESIGREDLKEKDQEGAYIIKAPVVSQVIIPPNLIPGTIEALKTNYAKYLKENESVKKPK